MASTIALTTIGVIISYASETSAGTRPTTGYTKLHGLKSTPDFNVSPNTADVTTFDNREYTSKVDLLKEMPDNLEFNAQLSPALIEDWENCIEAYETAKSSSKSVWFCIDIVGMEKSIFIKGKPQKMGLPSMEANSAIEVTLYITPYGEPEFESDPTYA